MIWIPVTTSTDCPAGGGQIWKGSPHFLAMNRSISANATTTSTSASVHVFNALWLTVSVALRFRSRVPFSFPSLSLHLQMASCRTNVSELRRTRKRNGNKKLATLPTDKSDACVFRLAVRWPTLSHGRDPPPALQI